MDDILDYMVFERETSVIYPFSVFPENLSAEQREELESAAKKAKLNGFELDVETIHDICSSVLGELKN